MRKTKRASRTSKEEEEWLANLQLSFNADASQDEFDGGGAADLFMKEVRVAMNARNNVSDLLDMRRRLIPDLRTILICWHRRLSDGNYWRLTYLPPIYAR
jgi:hypothetical protein